MERAIHHEKLLGLSERFRHDWIRAAKELLGIDLTNQQKLVVESVQNGGSMTTVTTPAGVGMHTALSAICILHTVLYPNAQTVLASPPLPTKDRRFTLRRLNAHMQMQWGHALAAAPFLNDIFKLTKNSFEHRHDRCHAACFKTYQPGNEEALAGFCSENSLFIITDAASVADSAYRVLLGGMLSENARMLLLSVPSTDDRDGFFYRSHHQRALRDGNPHGIYSAIKLSAEESPLVHPSYLSIKEQEYGGRESAKYRTHILGEFI